MTQVAEDKLVGAWDEAIREAAKARCEAMAFPSTKDEEWRFTNVSPIVKTSFRPGEHDTFAATAAVENFSFGEQAAAELVFVNGKFTPCLSKLPKLPRGVHAGGLADAIKSDSPLVKKHLSAYAAFEKNKFVAWNTSALRDGAFVHLSRGATLEGPIHLLFVSVGQSEPTMTHPRVLVVAEEGAIGSVVESYVGLDGATYLTNAVTEIVAADDARIDHCKLQQETLGAYHIASMQVELGRNANFVSHAATLGGKLTRNELTVVMNGEHADATLNGLVIIGGQQHVDNHTLLVHAKPNCPSHELYKHVLDKQATGVFKGKIYVEKDAQKTDSKQTSKSLLLSDEASMNSMPALEIYADDVKCTHGSTTGPVDEEMVFYLRSRGISLEAARHLLTYAFAADITRRIKVEPVRRRLEDYMANQHGLPQDLRITHLGSHDEKAL